MSILAFMIRVRNLAHRFGDNQVLHGINLDIKKGDIAAIMGSSGGGKTTLLRCMAGLLKPSEGSVEILEKDIWKMSEEEFDEIRKHIGVVFQGAALFDYLSVFDNIIFGAIRQRKHSRQELEELVKEMLEMVGLEGTEEQYPGELSGGMKKRVGLARALATHPEILFYDEPTSGLDPIIAYAIDGLIAEIGERVQATSVIVSHDLISVLRVARRIIFLFEGEIIADETPESFMKSKDSRIKELIEKAEAMHVEAPLSS